MAKLDTLTDPFDQNTLNGTKWSQFTGGSATMGYNSTGATMTYPASTTSSTDGDISSNSSYDLTDSYALLQVLSTTSNANCDNTLRLYNGNNRLQIQKEGTTLYFQKVVAGSQTNIASVTYNATTHKWWRIRESSGTTYWETSPDGIAWTVQTSQATPITVTALSVLIAGTAFGTASSPGTFKWNNFNTAPASGVPTNLFFAAI
jgi:hypothetical protein